MRNANEGVSLSEIVTKATLRKFGMFLPPYFQTGVVS